MAGGVAWVDCGVRPGLGWAVRRTREICSWLGGVGRRRGEGGGLALGHAAARSARRGYRRAGMFAAS